ncbi:2-oxo-4-hydroxy-4-carboxy-5-ureidoimidazoline decarboxylase [Microcoleus sp. FACHB-1515]|uniref:2-oxo-4-hydroxy-4-carboxy-5-ureidoimidazoline decarboxylase n=1 Tax=Cyanophyceae TaxID=3028117 RepID=UPI001687AD50|nr:2-oxo-4-hydroxy-4-carboxy-5-ureidoimidazoline decarboxylase [Microcoleus sp. FACHB-1515]MBD2092100.1 2-oxo-4-hydroxy-4-carboxy-5-ureidoimidazoline decarboxylase [Microcoleus sp. FACHB-1515]
MTYSIAQLNEMSEAEFVSALGDIFENTPDIAREVYQQRPFFDLEVLVERMEDAVFLLDEAAKLALIQAHPDLGSQAKMADASIQEQAGVGLDRLTSEEFDRFQTLNQTYKERFGFPFVMAVKNQTKESILEAFDRRLENPFDTEIDQALEEITKIAEFRLRDRVEPA